MTTEILLATNASNPTVVGSYKMEATAEEKARQLPEPRGYRILCAIPEVEKEFEDSEIGLIKADATISYDEKHRCQPFLV